jgi:DNA-binding response OmpR family regulator
MEVIEAQDGTVGVELARSEMPDVILLDVMMPGMDGWEVLQALQAGEGTSEIPIVFLTARAELRDRAQGLELGGIDYVTKPFNPIDLAPLVNGLLARVERGEREAIRQERIAALRDMLIE